MNDNWKFSDLPYTSPDVEALQARYDALTQRAKDAQAYQRHRAGAGGRIRGQASALRLQKAQRLPAQPAAFGGIRPVPAGLLRVRVQRESKRH